MNQILDTPRFLFADLSKVTGLDQTNLKGWLSRGAVSFSEFDRKAGGSGRRRLLTLRTVYEFALTSHLVKLGFAPSRAFQNVCVFSRRVEARGSDKDTRNPDTLLFDRGQTIFTICPLEDEESAAFYIEHEPLSHEAFDTYTFIGQIDDGEDDPPLLKILFPHNSFASTILHCNPILQSVDKMLDVRRA